MFVHAGFGHLFFNMLALFFFGPPLERTWGSRDFIRYYLVCGVGGSVAALLLVNLVGVAPMVGASAAIFGILLAFALTWPDAPIYLWFLVVSIREVPQAGLWILAWMVSVTVLTWPKFVVEIVPNFLDGIRAVFRVHQRDDR